MLYQYFRRSFLSFVMAIMSDWLQLSGKLLNMNDILTPMLLESQLNQFGPSFHWIVYMIANHIMHRRLIEKEIATIMLPYVTEYKRSSKNNILV